MGAIMTVCISTFIGSFCQQQTFGVPVQTTGFGRLLSEARPTLLGTLLPFKRKFGNDGFRKNQSIVGRTSLYLHKRGGTKNHPGLIF
jgi:hypothetical protein